jgi:uncharacterized protein
VVDLSLIGAAAAIFVAAALAQAVTGFGSALVAVPLLTLVTDPVTAVVVATGVSLVLSSGAAWRERAHVDVRPARTLTVAGVLGMPAGLLVLALLDEALLTACIAVTMLVLVVLVACGLRIPERALPVAGLASGALLTSTGMNGPPLVMALVEREPVRYRATLQAAFAGQDLVAVAAFVVLGLVHREALLLTVAGTLGLPIGWRVGDVVFRRIPADRLRHVVVGGLVLTGLSMLVTTM